MHTNEENADTTEAAALWTILHTRSHSTRPSLAAITPNPPFDQQEVTLGLAVLQTQFSLTPSQLDSFNEHRYIRLSNVVPPAVLVSVRKRLQTLASSATGGRDVSTPPGIMPSRPPLGSSAAEIERWWSSISEPVVQSWHMQMMWAADESIRALVLSPRLGTIVCNLLGCTSVRLYHDNALSRAPGSKATRWHCDDGPNGYMIMEGTTPLHPPPYTLLHLTH